jgi:hypothetical protein
MLFLTSFGDIIQYFQYFNDDSVAYTMHLNYSSIFISVCSMGVIKFMTTLSMSTVYYIPELFVRKKSAIDDLKTKIVAAFTQITPEMLNHMGRIGPPL